MAIGTPTGLGSNTVAGTGTTVAVTVGSAVAIGTQVVVGGGASGSGALASVADSRGNTYVVDQTSSTLRGCGIASSVLTTALQINDTITLTYTTSANNTRSGWAASVTGLASSGALDKHSGNSGTTAAWNGGATGTLTQGDEILWGTGMRAANGSSTPATNFTELYDFVASSQVTSAVYWIVSVTTTQTPGGTWSASGTQWEAETATYKMASAAAATLFTRLLLGVGQ